MVIGDVQECLRPVEEVQRSDEPRVRRDMCPVKCVNCVALIAVVVLWIWVAEDLNNVTKLPSNDKCDGTG